jgi:hypothetical protein
MTENNESKFKEIWSNITSGVTEFSELLDDNSVVIGGVAAFFHTEDAIKRGLQISLEITFDVDLFVSQFGSSIMRSFYETTNNARLHKKQVTVNGIEYDVYVERGHRLRIDYEDLFRESVILDNIRVCCLEHLLLLKLDAFMERFASSHGEKDKRDIAKIITILGFNGSDVLFPYLFSDEDKSTISLIMRSNVFRMLSDGNVHSASRLKSIANIFARKLL